MYQIESDGENERQESIKERDREIFTGSILHGSIVGHYEWGCLWH